MMYDVFTVYDEKAEAFLPPWILPNIAMAKRVFSDCVNSNSHQFGANPADYTLFRLGSWTDHDAQYLLSRGKQSLGNGVEFRKPEHPISPELGNGQDTSEASVDDDAPVLSSPASENPPI